MFITRNGTWHYPVNIQGRLRHIRLLDGNADLTALQGVTPHSVRRTVATEIDEVYDAPSRPGYVARHDTWFPVNRNRARISLREP